MQSYEEKPRQPLSEDAVRPFDKVTIKYTSDRFAPKDSTDSVHPNLAEKLVAAGKAELVSDSAASKKSAKSKAE